MASKSIKFIVLIIFLFCISFGAYKIMKHPYQMCVLVDEYDSEAAEWPSKRVWFDASPWLKQRDRYIKVDSFYLIDLQFALIEESKSNLIRALHQSIKQSSLGNGVLKLLANMSDEPGEFSFRNRVKDTIRWEYLYTDFDAETLKPIYDFFLIKFSFNDQSYEIEMRRHPTIYKEMPYGFLGLGILSNEGTWHQQNTEKLSYEKYKIPKNNDQ